MNAPMVDQIAKAVLYEGYMLYPYRPSSVKNQQRWNFGVLYPDSYAEVEQGNERCSMRAECLVSGCVASRLAVNIRFLHLLSRSSLFQDPPQFMPEALQEAVERQVALPQKTIGELLTAASVTFEFQASVQSGMVRIGEEGKAFVVRRQEALAGRVVLNVEALEEGLFRVSAVVCNTTPLASPRLPREEALLRSLVSAHAIFQLEAGSFVSLLDPPEEFRQQAAACQNLGVWPVLVGAPGQRDTVLASPIILYDYPQIAPESAGDLFDGTEIDEILSLRIMTLTDEEKEEIRRSDDRVRQVLERTDALPAEQFLKLHGAVRGMRPVNSEEP